MGQAIADLEARALEQLERDGVPAERIELRRYADCRYLGQGYELRARGPAGPVDADFVARLIGSFHDEHQREYGRHFPDKEVELVNLRVVGVGHIPRIEPAALEAGGPVPDPTARTGQRVVYFEIGGRANALETPVWRRDRLKAGNRIAGPAIVEQMDSTTVLTPDSSAEVDRAGNLVISMMQE
jgi:N-methylhydantoinase A/oxoprolinase/acetone carboxylase beta subunit